MKFSKIIAIASLTSIGFTGTALAQAAGDTVYGPQGGVVGTIESVDGGNAVVNTGNLSTALPVSVFGEGENGPTIGWTKADLEAAVTAAQQEAAANLAAAMVVGAAVQTADPLPLGTIDSIDGDNVVLLREDETKVTLPKNLFALDAEGALIARVTMTSLEEALAAQAGG